MALTGGNPSCSEVINAIQDHLPALYFTFSRGKTELLADELSREWDFLFPREKERVREMVREAEAAQPGLFGPRRSKLKQILTQGIAYHHAGLSPALKDLVERLYEKRLIYVLFCTETFAVGVNFPAASTVFDACRKWDGREFRGLLNREFFQMAGRAGRRGFDPVGMVYVRVDDRFPEQTGFYSEEEIEPVRGHLIISPNTVLSLLYWKTDEEINRLLEQNLAVYQNNREGRKIKQDLAELDEKLAGLREVFCPQVDTPACYILRSKLKKELRSLARKNKRGRPGTRERREEIRNLLKTAQKKCHHRPCAEARRKQADLAERKSRLERRMRVLGSHSRDYERDFNRVWDLLEDLSYVEGRKLLPRGMFALHLHVQEILVTELVFNGFVRDMPPALVAAILAGVDYIPGRDDRVDPGPYNLREVELLRKSLLRSGVPENFCVWSPLPGPLASAWYEGASFEELQSMSNFQEGDIFSVIRREIDLLRQIERAAGEDSELRRQVEHIRRRLDRDEVAVPGI
ncbi:MAG: RNA helicase [Peptococcaceae bacterium]|nr:RNA helicase [Peptococcaceae bacterium]